MAILRCQVCGHEKPYFKMGEVFTSYRIFSDLKDVCYDCGDKMNAHVNYYGVKNEKDKAAVRCILMNGVVVNEIYSKLMFAGYY